MRRLRNCSPELNWFRKIKFLNTFSSDLRYSGPSESFRQTVLIRVVGRYIAELSNNLEGRKKMFRTREEKELNESSKGGKNEKDTWFRKDEATSTIAVHVSPNGILSDRVRKNLQRVRNPEGTKTKLVEDGGIKSRTGLVESNQFCRKECERYNCVMCDQNEGNKVT